MAFYNKRDNEELQQQGQGQPDPNQPKGGAGGMIEADGSGSSGGVQKNPNQSGSGSYTNLQDYLKANEDKHFGAAFGEKANESVDANRDTMNTSGEGYQANVVDPGRTTYDPNLGGKIHTNAGGLTDDEKNKVKAGVNADYTPTTFADSGSYFTDASNAVSNGKATGDAVQTSGGRKGLLATLYQHPRYTTGQQNLDNLFIQGDNKAADAIQKTVDNSSKLDGDYKDLLKSLGVYADEARQESLDTRKHYRDDIGIDIDGNLTGTGAYGDIMNDLTNRAAEANANIAGHLYNITNGLAGGTPSEETGLVTQPTYGTDLSPYIKTPNKVTRDATATPEDEASIAALLDLAGLSGSDFNPDVAQYNPEADSYFDTGEAQKAIDTRKTEYSNLLKNTLIPIFSQNATVVGDILKSIDSSLPPEERLKKVTDALTSFMSQPTRSANTLPIEDAIRYLAEMSSNSYTQPGLAPAQQLLDLINTVYGNPNGPRSPIVGNKKSSRVYR